MLAQLARYARAQRYRSQPLEHPGELLAFSRNRLLVLRELWPARPTRPLEQLMPFCVGALPIRALRLDPIAARSARVARAPALADDALKPEAIAVIEQDRPSGNVSTCLRKGTRALRQSRSYHSGFFITTYSAPIAARAPIRSLPACHPHAENKERKHRNDHDVAERAHHREAKDHGYTKPTNGKEQQPKHNPDGGVTHRRSRAGTPPAPQV